MRPLLLFLLPFASVFAIAQTPATLEFDSAKHAVVFVSARPPVAKPEDSRDVSGTSVDIQLPTAGSVYVWDRDTGNIAAKPVGQVGKKWHIADKEFNRIGLVSVRVEHQGEPVSAARIVLKDKTREQSQVLDESAKGEADFFIVQPGMETVTVEYRSGGQPAQPVVQQFPLDLDRKNPDPLLTVALPDATATISPVKSSGTTTQATPTASAPSVRHSNPWGSLLVFLVTLLLVAAIAWGLYHLAKKNPDFLKGKLDKLGVDVPEPSSHQDASGPVPTLEPAKPSPQQKIILDGGGLSPELATAPVASAVALEPVLKKANGEFARLSEGETIVGREDGLGLSLAGESSVSRRHASIRRQGTNLTVKDLGSTNGTFVNGRRIDVETPLAAGDDVQFGAVKFRVETR